mmetsp:Transcript_3114/g.4664  ORF Transcript_3114/g.4664 Transcript_3114/m.4664 type:complete len:241 (+) Transcript_3114:621-1343(+)
MLGLLKLVFRRVNAEKLVMEGLEGACSQRTFIGVRRIGFGVPDKGTVRITVTESDDSIQLGLFVRDLHHNRMRTVECLGHLLGKGAPAASNKVRVIRAHAVTAPHAEQQHSMDVVAKVKGRCLCDGGTRTIASKCVQDVLPGIWGVDTRNHLIVFKQHDGVRRNGRVHEVRRESGDADLDADQLSEDGFDVGERSIRAHNSDGLPGMRHELGKLLRSCHPGEASQNACDNRTHDTLHVIA